MTQQPPSPGFKTIAPRMSTALGETAQPQAAIGSECVQTMCREEPRIAREGAAPELLTRLIAHDVLPVPSKSAGVLAPLPIRVIMRPLDNRDGVPQVRAPN